MKDNMTDKQLNDLADIITTKLVSNVKSMQAFIDDIQSRNTIDMLNIDKEVLLLGEVAKLYTIMDACKQDEMYEKCAVIKDEIKKVKKQLNKFK